MNRFKRLLAMAVATLIGAALIAGPASAAPGGKLRKAPLHGITAVNLVNAAATQLSVTPEALTTAIRDSANARVDARVAAKRLSTTAATTIKARIAGKLPVAIRWSTTVTVASNLAISTDALNAGFRAARRALATQRIDAALAAGKITQAQADRLKARLAAAKLPGYKAFFGFGFWTGGFRRFPHPKAP